MSERDSANSPLKRSLEPKDFPTKQKVEADGFYDSPRSKKKFEQTLMLN